MIQSLYGLSLVRGVLPLRLIYRLTKLIHILPGVSPKFFLQLLRAPVALAAAAVGTYIRAAAPASPKGRHVPYGICTGGYSLGLERLQRKGGGHLRPHYPY